MTDPWRYAAHGVMVAVRVTPRGGRDAVDGIEELANGKSVVKVEQSDDTGTATGYVLVDGKHYLVKLERTEGDQPGKLEFSDFNKEFEVDAPSEDEVIDLSTLQ